MHNQKAMLPFVKNGKPAVKQLNLSFYLKQLYRAVRFTNVYSEKLSIAFANLRV